MGGREACCWDGERGFSAWIVAGESAGRCDIGVPLEVSVCR